MREIAGKSQSVPESKTHEPTTFGAGIGIVRPSSQIPPSTNCTKHPYVNVSPDCRVMDTSVRVLPENSPPRDFPKIPDAEILGEVAGDHPEDSDVGECDPGYPPEDI
jgi:hypothetical protein